MTCDIDRALGGTSSALHTHTGPVLCRVSPRVTAAAGAARTTRNEVLIILFTVFVDYPQAVLVICYVLNVTEESPEPHRCANSGASGRILAAVLSLAVNRNISIRVWTNALAQDT